jgi:endonuclease-3 related protein
LEQYEVESWWPKGDVFEVAVGAILTQQTKWSNVLKVLQELRSKDVLSADSLVDMDIDELETVLRPVGFFRQKSVRLKTLALFIQREYQSDMNLMMAKDLRQTRLELLELPGIGPETADSILLFGASHPVFIAANYCLRILNRLGIIESSDYEEVRQFVENEIGNDPDILAEFYALLVEHAKQYCLSKPKCPQCFLQDLCFFKT